MAVLGRLRVILWVLGLFRAELTSLVNLGSVRSTWASVITVRELRHGEVETLATIRAELSVLVSFSSRLSSDRSTWASITPVCELWHGEVNAPVTASRQAPFASQPRPGMKRVGFRYSARALAQGWGSAGG